MGIATAFDGGRRNTELFGERAKREPGDALQNDNVQSGRQESVDRSVIPQIALARPALGGAMSDAINDGTCMKPRSSPSLPKQ
jgi:hypothetical protein